MRGSVFMEVLKIWVLVLMRRIILFSVPSPHVK